MLLTEVALVGPGARVQRSVFTQIAAGGETFATYFTPERAWNLPPPPFYQRRFLCKNQVLLYRKSQIREIIIFEIVCQKYRQMEGSSALLS